MKNEDATKKIQNYCISLNRKKKEKNYTGMIFYHPFSNTSSALGPVHNIDTRPCIVLHNDAFPLIE